MKDIHLLFIMVIMSTVLQHIYCHKSQQEDTTEEEQNADPSNAYDGDTKDGFFRQYAKQLGFVSSQSVTIRGLFKGSCLSDGLYYYDMMRFVVCSEKQPHVQLCAPGTHNVAARHYVSGMTVSFNPFCIISMVKHGMDPRDIMPKQEQLRARQIKPEGYNNYNSINDYDNVEPTEDESNESMFDAEISDYNPYDSYVTKPVVMTEAPPTYQRFKNNDINEVNYFGQPTNHKYKGSGKYYYKRKNINQRKRLKKQYKQQQNNDRTGSNNPLIEIQKKKNSLTSHPTYRSKNNQYQNGNNDQYLDGNNEQYRNGNSDQYQTGNDDNKYQTESDNQQETVHISMPLYGNARSPIYLSLPQNPSVHSLSPYPLGLPYIQHSPYKKFYKTSLRASQ